MANNRQSRGIPEPDPFEIDYAAPAAAPTKDEIEAESKRINNDTANRDRRRRKLAAVYRAEKKVPLMIAPFYAAYFGKVMTVSLNGIPVYVPCDGHPHDVPESYAMTVQQRLNAVNEQLALQTRFSNVSSNLETSPGAARMI